MFAQDVTDVSCNAGVRGEDFDTRISYRTGGVHSRPVRIEPNQRYERIVALTGNDQILQHAAHLIQDSRAKVAREHPCAVGDLEVLGEPA